MVKKASKSKPICQVGDRILVPGNRWGTVTSTSHTSILPYKIRWDNGHEATYKKAELERYEIHPPEPEAEDIEEEEANLWEAFGEKQWKAGDRVTTTPECDWQPGELIIIDASDPNNTVVEVSGRPAILAAEFLQPWNPSPSSTCAAESESASPSPASSSEDLPLLDYANGMNTAEIFSQNDTPVCPSQSTLKAQTKQDLAGGNAERLEKRESISSLPRHPAPLSQSKVKDSEPPTSETVSQQSSERSQAFNPDILRSKTLEDSLAAPISQGSKSGTLQESSLNFPSAGTMRNGKWSAQEYLKRPSCESDYFWLASPGAMSSSGNGRPPGTDRLTDDLQKKELISSTEVAAPEFLEKSFNIPSAWTSPSELRAATELLADAEKPSEIVSILASPPSPSQEFSTSTVSLKTEEELTPVDDAAVGKHFWHDEDTVTVEVLSVQNWRETPKSRELIKIARCRPWWTHENGERVRADVIVLPLSELTELEEEDFLELLPERSLVEQPSSLQKCPSCDQALLTLDDGCGVCGWTSSLQKSETYTERESCQTGSLYKDTKWQETKLGRVEYPKVDIRDPDNDDHWYWYLSYVVKDGNHKKKSAKGNGGFRDATAYVPRGNLPLVRSLIRHSVPVEVTLEVVGLKFLWLDFKGSWAIGEVKPEACPQLCLISMDEKQVLIIPGSEWGELKPAARSRKQQLISEAIANNQPLSYIKEMLNAQRVPQSNTPAACKVGRS